MVRIQDPCDTAIGSAGRQCDDAPETRTVPSDNAHDQLPSPRCRCGWPSSTITRCCCWFASCNCNRPALLRADALLSWVSVPRCYVRHRQTGI